MKFETKNQKLMFTISSLLLITVILPTLSSYVILVLMFYTLIVETSFIADRVSFVKWSFIIILHRRRRFRIILEGFSTPMNMWSRNSRYFVLAKHKKHMKDSFLIADKRKHRHWEHLFIKQMRSAQMCISAQVHAQCALAKIWFAMERHVSNNYLT